MNLQPVDFVKTVKLETSKRIAESIISFDETIIFNGHSNYGAVFLFSPLVLYILS